MSFEGGTGVSSSSLPSRASPTRLRRFGPPIPMLVPPSSTIQCTDFARSNNLVSHPFSGDGGGAEIIE